VNEGVFFMKLLNVAGARPNFMKVAPIIEAIESYNNSNSKKIEQLLIHTGQHYDQNMSRLFFHELGIPEPYVNLEVGSASHAEQTAEIMKRFEKICVSERPTHILVVGDVNSTIACSLVASKLRISVIHVEAGLRSFDRSMPEEINRVLTDAISDILFTTEESAKENLCNEGKSEKNIYFVGNVMIDTLLKHKEKAKTSNVLNRIGLQGSRYALLTLHRPSNVDDKKIFTQILEALLLIGKDTPIIFPIHPRSLMKVIEYGLEKYFNWMLYERSFSVSGINENNRIIAIQPQGYLDFLQLLSNSVLVLTDSGGIQEETTVLGIPCVTLRENTERPITITKGTNVLAGTDRDNIVRAAASQLSSPKMNLVPPLWDGKASERIVDVLKCFIK